MFDKLTDTIKKTVTLTHADLELCRRSFEPVVFPKNRILEEEGHIPKYLYFVVSGYVRLFSYNEAGDEITTHINCPPGFITSYSHYSQQTKASENVECITDCELLRITKGDLDHCLEQSSALKDFGISIFQQSLAYNENRSRELSTLTAEQRYQKLIENYPGILHNVPLQYIASFLGMNPKSLSRIRRHIIK